MPRVETISGSDGSVTQIATGLGLILPNHKWPIWAGGYHLPDILQLEEIAPSISASDTLHDYNCPETYVISGGGIIGGVKQDIKTRLDNT